MVDKVKTYPPVVLRTRAPTTYYSGVAGGAVDPCRNSVVHLWCYTCYTVCCRFYPVAVVLLVARLTLEMTDPVEALRLVSRFLLTVVVGEVVHFLVILPLIYWIFTRRNPFSFLLSVSRALIMALAASDRSVSPTLVSILLGILAVGHPEKTRGRVAKAKSGCATFFQKRHENEQIWTERGHVSLTTPRSASFQYPVR